MAGRPDCDVLVVGAGPAGTTLSRLLALRGWRVTVLDRRPIPRPKACGEFVSPGALSAMRRVGIDTAPLEGAAGPVWGWEFSVGGAHARAQFDRGRAGISLPRARLDQHLAACAEAAGVRILTETTFTRATESADGIRASTRALGSGGRSGDISARFLVGAGGLRCPVSAGMGPRPRARHRKVSLTCHVAGLSWRPGFGRLRIDGPLTAGAAPSDPSGESWNVTVVASGRRLARELAPDPTGFFWRALQSLGWLEAADRLRDDGAGSSVIDGPWASGPFDRPTPTRSTDRRVVIGDAAGYYDPLTGQGIYQAIRSAELLAPHLHSVLVGSARPGRAFGHYARTVGRERRRTVRLQRLIDGALRGPRRQALTGELLKAWPALYHQLIQVTGDAKSPTDAARALVGRIAGSRGYIHPTPEPPMGEATH